MFEIDSKFFDERLLYYGLEEFYNKRILIKSLYQCKSYDEIYLYRMYVYSRAFISDTWKNNIWEYLNNDISDKEFRDMYKLYMDKKRCYY